MEFNKAFRVFPVAGFLIAGILNGQTISGGTAAVIVRSPTRVAVAIDSKEVYRRVENGRIRNTETCASKMRRIGNFVAVVAGFSRGSANYDALEIVASRSKPSDNLADLVAVTQHEVGQGLQVLLRDLTKGGANIETFHNRADAAVQVGILGVEGDTPKVSIVEFFVDDPSGETAPRSTVKSCPGDCGSKNYAFLLGTHAEMQTELLASPKLLREEGVEGITRLVAIEANAHPDTVGGPIATAVAATRGPVVVHPAACAISTGRTEEATAVGVDASTGNLEGVSEDSLRSLFDAQLARVSELECHQKVQRFHSKGSRTKYLDNLDFDIELHSGSEKYTRIKLNNIDYPSLEYLPGSWSSGELATILRVTRDALESFSIEREAGSNQISVKFLVPAQRRQWYLITNGSQYWMEIAGKINMVGTQVSSIEWTGTNLPRECGINSLHLKIDFTETEISEQKFRVPTSSIFSVAYASSSVGTTLDVSKYSNYRRLGAQSTITFN